MMTTRLAPWREFDLTTRSAARSSSGAFDAVRTDGAVELSFDLPGFDPASIDLSVDEHVLNLSAERNWQAPEDSTVLVAERRHGTLRRQLRLSRNLDPAGIDARFDNGVLVVRIPVAETAQPRKVEISLGTSEVVDASAIGAGEDSSGSN